MLDDVDDLLDGHIGLRATNTNAGDAEVSYGAVEVGREDLGPIHGVFGLAMLVGLRQRADGEQVPVGSDGMVHADVVNRESVGVRVKFDLAGAIEGKVFEAEVLHRANADTEIVVTAEFEIRLVVDLEMPNVGNAPQGDVADRTGERGTVVETFHTGEDADGDVAVVVVPGPAGDVFDDDALDGTVAGCVVFPFPGV